MDNETTSLSPQPTQPVPLRLLALVVILSLFAGFAGGYWGALRRISDTKQPLASSGQVQELIHERSAVVDVVKKASPAVVSIVISKDLNKVPGFSTNPFFDDPFAPFFGFNGGQSPRQSPQQTPNIQPIGAGSGFLVSSDGLILTNKHVVSDEQASYTVLTNDHKKYDAKVLARDPVNDLALVKIDIHNAPTLSLADSTALDIGEQVIAIGNSLGQYQNTVTTGVVSGIGRSIAAGGSSEGVEQLEGVIQTDAAINPGNSGGPLLNIAGQVIGINTAIDQQGQLVGFAIPSSDAQKAVDSFKKNGKITRAFLGVRYVMITEELARSQRLPKDSGALIIRGDTLADLAVVPGSPANKAGLEENDIILKVNGDVVDEEHTLAGLIKKYSVGETVTLTIYHKGAEKTVQVTLEESK